MTTSKEVTVRLRSANPGPERPARPGFGTAGRAVALRADFFALESMPDMIYEYIVQITPEPKSQKPRMKRRVLALFELTSPMMARSTSSLQNPSPRNSAVPSCSTKRATTAPRGTRTSTRLR